MSAKLRFTCSKPPSSQTRFLNRPVLIGAENTLICVATNFSCPPFEQEEE